MDANEVFTDCEGPDKSSCVGYYISFSRATWLIYSEITPKSAEVIYILFVVAFVDALNGKLSSGLVIFKPIWLVYCFALGLHIEGR